MNFIDQDGSNENITDVYSSLFANLIDSIRSDLESMHMTLLVDVPVVPSSKFGAFVYALSRQLATRRDIHRSGSKSADVARIVLALIAASDEDFAWMNAYPPLQIGILDEEVVVSREPIKVGVDVKRITLISHGQEFVSTADLTLILQLRRPLDVPLLLEGRILRHLFPESGMTLELHGAHFSSYLRCTFEVIVSNFGPDDAHIIEIISPKKTKIYQRKIVISQLNDSTGPSTPIADTMVVWTMPAVTGIVQYSMAALRLGGMSSSILRSIIPVLLEKIDYLRNTAPELKHEVVEAVEVAALNFVPGPSETPDLLFDVVRLLFRLSADDVAARIGTHAVRIFGDKNHMAHILKGRCLEASKQLEAIECFQTAHKLEPNNQEAVLAITRITKLLSSRECGAATMEPMGVVPPSKTNSPETPSLSGGRWERLVSKKRLQAHERLGFETLDVDSRLSSSVMYDLMRNFYVAKGLEAWGCGAERRTDTVPFYITSNPYIVTGYVRVFINVIHDLAASGLLDPAEPMYLIELGAGPGKFSALFLAILKRELALGCLTHVQVCYIMTDFCPGTIAAWESDPAFVEYIDCGLLDFALYDCDKPDVSEINLIHRSLTISKETPAFHPLMVFSNYVFDSIRMDAFRVRDGCLQEALVSTFVLGTGAESTEIDPSIPGSIRQEWKYKSISEPSQYYGNSGCVNGIMGDVVDEYSKVLPDGSSFTFPLSGLRTIGNLQSLSQSGLVMLIADKGHNRERMLARSGDPIISLHGSLSMMVNLDAVGRFARRLAGDLPCTVIHTPQQNSSLDVCFVSLGVSVPRASVAFVSSLCLFSVFDLFTLRDHVEDVAGIPLPLTVIVTIIKLSCFDPDVLAQFADRIAECLEEGSSLGPAARHATRIAAELLLQNMSSIKVCYAARFDVDGSARDAIEATSSRLGDFLNPVSSAD